VGTLHLAVNMLIFDPYALFTLLTFLFRNISGHTSPGWKSFFFFSRAPYILRTTYFSSDNGGRLYFKLVEGLQQLLGWRFD
jgi:hypothetical protein